MSEVIRPRFAGRVSALCLAAPLLWAVGCGGSTDIGFQGYDAGPGSGGVGASGGSGGLGGGITDGGTGGTNVGGVGNAPGGGGVGGDGGVGGGGSGGVPGGGGAPGGGGTGGVICGGAVCTPPPVPIGQVEACCAGSAGELCGITSSFLGGQCAELNQAGQLDPNCPEQNIQGFPLPGCCKPNGKCGVMDTFIGLGCVDPEQFGGPPSPNCAGVTDAGTGGTGGGGTGGAAGFGGSGGGTTDAGTGGSSGAPGEKNCGVTNPDVCTPSEVCCILAPGADYCSDSSQPCQCTQPGCELTPAACDGPEDCPGEVCCGTFSQQQQQYTQLACKATCNGQAEREICHPGGTCTDASKTCSASQFLPSYIHRCN